MLAPGAGRLKQPADPLGETMIDDVSMDRQSGFPIWEAWLSARWRGRHDAPSVSLLPSAAMRRWLAVFLLVFLPLQFTWSAAAAYCQHESGKVQHFGHHDHKHAGDAGAQGAKKAPAGIDEDCAFCHAGCVSALTGVVALTPPLAADSSPPWAPHFLASPPGDLPERPNWIASA